MRELPSVRAVLDDVLAHLPAKAAVGADEERIAQLAELVRRVSGLELPPGHVEFLRLMGGGPPPIDFTADADSAIDRVIDRYSSHLEDRDTPPPGCVLVAVGGLHVEEVALRVDDGTVWAADGDQLVRPMGDSWLGFLSRRAWMTTGRLHLPVTLTAVGKREIHVLDPVRTTLHELGWESWSDSIAVCAGSPDGRLAVAAEQPPGLGGWLAVDGHDGAGILPVAEALLAATGLQPEGWWGPWWWARGWWARGWWARRWWARRWRDGR